MIAMTEIMTYVTLEHKSSVKSLFVAITKNTLYGQNYLFVFYAKNHYDIKIMFHEDI